MTTETNKTEGLADSLQEISEPRVAVIVNQLLDAMEEAFFLGVRLQANQKITRSVTRRLLIQDPELRAEVLWDNEEWLREQYEHHRAMANEYDDFARNALFKVGRRFFGWGDGE